MSITLITAVPGGGKTSHVVWNVIRPACEAQRVVYCNAIPKLKLDVIPTTREELRTWPDREPVDPNDPEGIFRLLNFHEGSLIVADEIQYLWPKTGAKIPSEDIKYLTQHRKHGLDFVLITQSPHLVHSDVLQVVDKHIHIVPTWSGRKMYEWPEYCSSPKARTNQQNAVKSQYKIPEQSFDLYYSATQHTKVERKKPKILFAVLGVIALLPILGYAAYERVMSRLETDETVQIEEIEKNESFVSDSLIDEETFVSSSVITETVSYLPTVLSQQYDWSNISACMSSEKLGCVCYGYSAERLMIPLKTCELAVKHGWRGRQKIFSSS